MHKICVFSLVGQWALFTRFGGGGEMLASECWVMGILGAFWVCMQDFWGQLTFEMILVHMASSSLNKNPLRPILDQAPFFHKNCPGPGEVLDKTLGPTVGMQAERQELHDTHN